MSRGGLAIIFSIRVIQDLGRDSLATTAIEIAANAVTKGMVKRITTDPALEAEIDDTGVAEVVQRTVTIEDPVVKNKILLRKNRSENRRLRRKNFLNKLVSIHTIFYDLTYIFRFL